MKKIYFLLKSSLFLLGLLLLTQTEAQAQANWELGMRFGDRTSVEATIPIAAAPRFHPVAYVDGRFGLAGYFDWMFEFDGGPKGFKIYPGVGPEFHFGNDFDFDIAGDFGAEYSFDFPLTIAFDWRPGFRVTNDFKWKDNNWGFSARFRIGSGKIRKA